MLFANQTFKKYIKTCKWFDAFNVTGIFFYFLGMSIFSHSPLERQRNESEWYEDSDWIIIHCFPWCLNFDIGSISLINVIEVDSFLRLFCLGKSSKQIIIDMACFLWSTTPCIRISEFVSVPIHVETKPSFGLTIKNEDSRTMIKLDTKSYWNRPLNPYSIPGNIFKMRLQSTCTFFFPSAWRLFPKWWTKNYLSSNLLEI